MPITETRFKKKKTEEEVPDKDKAESSKSLSAHVEPQAKRDVGVFGMSYKAVFSPSFFFTTGQGLLHPPTFSTLKPPSLPEFTKLTINDTTTLLRSANQATV